MSYKPFFVLIIVICCSILQVKAQSTMIFMDSDIPGQYESVLFMDSKIYPADSLDRIIMRAGYSYAFVKDTLTGATEEGQATLEIGRTYTKYYNRLFFETDSLVRHGIVSSYLGNKKIAGSKVGLLTFYETFIHNLQNDEWTCTGRIITQDFLYKEKSMNIEWSIQDSTKIIAGYNAVMATCTFRGRDYTAWFTTEIPSQAGPWKFHGLPGLIISVSDKDGYYRFTLDNIYFTEGDIYLPDYLYLKTSRKKYMEAKILHETRYWVASEVYLVNSAVFVENTPESYASFTPLGNDFIETDL